MARKLIVEITLPEGSSGDYWNVNQLLRFFAEALENAGEGDQLDFRLVSDSNQKVEA